MVIIIIYVVIGMYICICNGITDTQIKHTITENKARTAEDVYCALEACFDCGACEDCVREIIEQEMAKNLDLVAAG